MEISFILSHDELFTLMSLDSGFSEAGERFVREALPNAETCDLSGLTDKKLARFVGGEMELSPVIRMAAAAASKADSVEKRGDGWLIKSPWVILLAEIYPHGDGCLKITPLKRDGFGAENAAAAVSAGK